MKKILSFLTVLLCAASMMASSVYFVNDKGWTTVNCYAWQPTANAAWPGVAMTKESYQLQDYDVYSFTAAEGVEYGKCIFNNGSSQTADFTWNADKYYFNGGWYTRAELEGETPEPPAVVMDTIYFVNNGNWTTVNCYAWAPANAAWPGEAMTLVEGLTLKGHNVYMYAHEEGLANCIFNNGSGTQTDNLTWTSKKYFWNGAWYTLAELQTEPQPEPVAGPVVLTFKDYNSTSGDSSAKMTASTESANGSLIDSLQNAAGFVTCTATSNAYGGRIGYGCKLGSGKATGDFTLALVEPALYDSIVVYASSYSATEGSLSINGGDAIDLTDGGVSNKVLRNIVYIPTDTVKTFSVATTAKRAYVKSITFYPKAVTPEPEPVVTPNYYLIGSFNNWNLATSLPFATEKDTIVVNWAAGTYTFKVVTPQIIDGTDVNWTSALGASQVDPECSSEGVETDGTNVKVTLANDGEVKINFVAGYLCITGEFGEVVITGWTIAGDSALLGCKWDQTATANDMTQDAETGIFELVKEGVELAAGTYYYKAVANHDWAVSAFPAEGNNQLVITEAGTYNVTFTFVPGESLTAVAIKQAASTYTVTVTINNMDPDTYMDDAAVYVSTDDEENPFAPLAEGENTVDAGRTLVLTAVTEGEGRVYTITVNGETVTLDDTHMYFINSLSENLNIVFTFSNPEPEPTGCDWDNIAFLGDGAGAGAYTNKYKMCAPTASNIVNIQKPGFADEAGIYVAFPAAITACSLAEGKYAVQGAGIVVYLSAFTAVYTDFTITDGLGTEHAVSVYYADGTEPVEGSGLYIVGTINDWTVALPAYEMTTVTEGFEFTFNFGATELVGQNFKITDATLSDWSDATINLGIGTDKLNPTTAIALTNGSNTNISIADGYSSATNVVITLKYVMGEWLLSATGDFVEGEPEMPALYLRGINGDWTANEDNMLIKADDADVWTRTLDVTDGSMFKVADAAWGDYNFGGTDEADLVLGEAYTLYANSSVNIALPAEALPGNYTFTLTKSEEGEWALTVVCNDSPATAIDNVEAGKVVKTIENGQMIIIRDGMKYNAQGVKF